MRGIVIFDTTYRNTRTIAETIAEELKESGIKIDTFYVKDIKKLRAEDYNFIVLGSPTKFGTMTFTVRRFLSSLKREEWMGKPFATFDTENPENIERKEGSAAEKIAEKLKEKQMKQLLPGLKAVVIGWKGPLQEGEIERAKKYAKELTSELKDFKSEA